MISSKPFASQLPIKFHLFAQSKSGSKLVEDIISISSNHNNNMLEMCLKEKLHFIFVAKSTLEQVPNTIFSLIAANSGTTPNEKDLIKLDEKGFARNKPGEWTIKKDIRHLQVILDYLRLGKAFFSVDDKSDVKNSFVHLGFGEKEFESETSLVANGTIAILTRRCAGTDPDNNKNNSYDTNNSGYQNSSNHNNTSNTNVTNSGKDFIPEIARGRLAPDFTNAIGEGANGKVYSGVLDLFTQVAIKPVRVSDENEVHTLRSCMGQHIIMIYGVTFIENQNLWCMVTERCQSDVWQYLKKQSPNLVQRLFLARDAIYGLAWLIEKGKVHSDIKPQNLFVSYDGQVKVGDFDTCQDINRKTPIGYTIGYVAPEVKNQSQPCSEKSDVYSFGRTLWEILYLVPGWESDSNGVVQNPLLFKGPIPWTRESHKIETPNPEKQMNHWVLLEEDHPLKRLIEKCVAEKPENRPSFKTVLQELNEIIIQLSIKSPEGRKFWTQITSGTQQNVSVDLLIEEILRNFAVPNDLIEEEHKNMTPAQQLYNTGKKVLSSLLKTHSGRNSQSMISITDFGKLLDLFGPLDANIYSRIKHVLEQPAFWGRISIHAAHDMLQRHPTPSHLVRMSCNGVNGHFTLDFSSPSGNSSNVEISRRRLAYQVSAPDPLKKFVHANQNYTFEGLLQALTHELDVGNEISGSPYYSNTLIIKHMSYSSFYDPTENPYLDLAGIQ